MKAADSILTMKVIFKSANLDNPKAEMKGIITLCGSTRFFEHFRLANLKLTCADWIVLSIGIDTRSDKQLKEAGL
jgi:hypothetical protein